MYPIMHAAFPKVFVYSAAPIPLDRPIPFALSRGRPIHPVPNSTSLRTKMSKLRNFSSKGDSNPGSFDCVSDILPQIYRAPYVLNFLFLLTFRRRIMCGVAGLAGTFPSLPVSGPFLNYVPGVQVPPMFSTSTNYCSKCSHLPTGQRLCTLSNVLFMAPIIKMIAKIRSKAFERLNIKFRSKT